MGLGEGGWFLGGLKTWAEGAALLRKIQQVDASGQSARRLANDTMSSALVSAGVPPQHAMRLVQVMTSAITSPPSVSDVYRDPLGSLQSLCAAMGISLAEDLVKPALGYMLRWFKISEDAILQCGSAITDQNIRRKLSDAQRILLDLVGGSFSLDLVSQLGRICNLDSASALIAPTISSFMLRAGVEPHVSELPKQHLTIPLLGEMATDVVDLVKSMAGVEAGDVMDALARICRNLGVADFFEDVIAPALHSFLLRLGAEPSAAMSVKRSVSEETLRSLQALATEMLQGEVSLDMLKRFSSALGFELLPMLKSMLRTLMLRLGVSRPVANAMAQNLDLQTFSAGRQTVGVGGGRGTCGSVCELFKINFASPPLRAPGSLWPPHF